jgi:2-polyprenyl-6-methoxyphenol hydroxylase-like FAD-dependent oxidoreductase
MAPFKVVIIGGGLAGSLLGTGLLNNGVEFEVCERLTRDAKREGYQIRLGENALKGFRACLTPEQKATVVAKFGRSGWPFQHVSSARRPLKSPSCCMS